MTMLAVDNMLFHTDDSTLPSSTVNSDTDSFSSQSFSSSNEQLDQSLDFLNHSWPLSTEPGNFDEPSRKVNNPSWRSNFKTVSCNSSNTSSPRSRPNTSTHRTRLDQAAERGCSPDASALYNNTTKYYNPSVSGQHACQEMSGYCDWANGYLQYSPHNTFITDLPRDLADGRTLLCLAEELLGVFVEPVHVKPALEVQKIENIQTCLDMLATHGIPVHDLSPEDIAEANTKVTLVLCKRLKQHFSSTQGSPQRYSGLMSIGRQTPSPRNKHTLTPPVGYQDTITPSATSFPVMDIEDIALLDWVGQMTGQLVTDYNSFQDGHILCLLINKLTNGAVPDVVLDYGLPLEKASLAIMFSEEELGVTCDLCPDDVVNINDVSKMSSLLTTLYRVFLDQAQDKHHDMKIQEMYKLRRKTSELMTKEKQANIELVREAQLTARRGLSDVLHTGTLKGKERSLVHIEDKMSPRFPSMAKVESKRRGISKERSYLGQNGLPSYLQDSGDQSPCENQLPNQTLEDLFNVGNSVHHPCHSIDVSLKSSPNKSSPRSKLVDVSCSDEELMHGLLPMESIFDSEKLTHTNTMPHVPKSWQKERENAQHQLTDFRNELKRLKEEYFRLMNMKALLTPEQNFLTSEVTPFRLKAFIPEDRGLINTDNIDCSSVDKMANKSKIIAEEPVKKSGQTSSCVIAYINVKKGTLPPYRTWSKYENTDCDRYRDYYTKTTLNVDAGKSRNETIATKVTHTPQVDLRSRNGIGSVQKSAECRSRQAGDAKQINPDCYNPLVSSPKKKIQDFKSRDTNDGPSGDSSQRASGRHRYGMTALARQSSKKANAYSVRY